MSIKQLAAKLTKNLTVLPLVFFLSLASVSAQGTDSLSTDQAVIDAGASLFRQNCASCHKVKERYIGPALEGVYDRRTLPQIIAFVKNSSKEIQSGDPYLVALYEEYNKLEMTAFDFFDDEQIVSIISYVKAEAEKEPEAVVVGDPNDPNTSGAGISTGYLNAILVGLVIVLILILIVLMLIVTVLQRYLNQKELDEDDKEILASPFNFEALLKNKATIGVLAFIFMAIVLKTVIDGAYNIGVQEGYAPTQPIAFSHKIHAGDFQIDCNYCHTGVRKSKNANIPSPNICMNCHNPNDGILKDSPEIKKIFAAVDNNAPIEWVRVHNLPDLAYFNHAQHVEVGNIECQTCHGPIEEMDVVRQHSNLTMGWCIDCHRKTDINTQGNAYYDKLVELHKEQSKEPMKVEDIGGLECSKCHY